MRDSMIGIGYLVIGCVACSAAPTPASRDVDEASVVADAGVKKDASSAAPKDDGDRADAGTSARACSETTTAPSCGDCCLARATNPKAADVYYDEQAACMCAPSGGLCATECAATACVNKAPEPGDACSTCIDAKLPTCNERALSACNADPDCAALNQCLIDARCDAKPAP